jgi:tRNA(Ile)-lysidine synthase
MARPLLSVARAELEAFAAQQQIAWVEDESNTDPRYARNALRHQVMPVLAQAFPGFQRRIARSGAHAQSAQRLLDELADRIWRLPGRRRHRPARLRLLSADRINNLLRHWFSQRGLGMPSTAWLEQMVAQLLSAREDAQPLVSHPEVDVRRHRDRLYLVPKQPELAGLRDPDDEGIIVKHAQAFRWRGEASMAFPDYGGVLHFDAAAHGFDAGLAARQATGNRLPQGRRTAQAGAEPADPRPQAAVPGARRPGLGTPRLPIVSSGFELLFAAGLGMDCRHRIRRGRAHRPALGSGLEQLERA